MLTIFSTPKPFMGHAGTIQRNALRSWTLLHPGVEVILFGHEEGAAEVCQELGIRHEPDVRRNENGTKYLNYMFERAYEISRHKFLCYVNCDIMLMSDFCEALRLTSKAHDEFLMIGRRWDTDITEPWDFQESTWEHRLRSLALLKGRRNGPSWVDYFCFSRDLYRGQMPPFLIGRHGWDPWLTWFARYSKVPVIDASRAVVAVHQNHDYAYLKKGAAASSSSAEMNYNLHFGDASTWRYHGADSATEIVHAGRLKIHRMAWFGPVRLRMVVYSFKIWFSVLRLTRPIRHWLGLRKKVLEQSS
jgi:hypothetical protein